MALMFFAIKWAFILFAVFTSLFLAQISISSNRQSNSEILGGDMVFAIKNREFLASESQVFSQNTGMKLYAAVVRNEKVDDQFMNITQVAAIENLYPLRGQVSAKIPLSADELQDRLGQGETINKAMLDPIFANQMQLNIGDQFFIDGCPFVHTGTFDRLPMPQNMGELVPKVLVSKKHLDNCNHAEQLRNYTNLLFVNDEKTPLSDLDIPQIADAERFNAIDIVQNISQDVILSQAMIAVIICMGLVMGTFAIRKFSETIEGLRLELDIALDVFIGFVASVLIAGLLVRHRFENNTAQDVVEIFLVAILAAALVLIIAIVLNIKARNFVASIAKITLIISSGLALSWDLFYEHIYLASACFLAIALIALIINYAQTRLIVNLGYLLSFLGILLLGHQQMLSSAKSLEEQPQKSFILQDIKVQDVEAATKLIQAQNGKILGQANAVSAQFVTLNGATLKGSGLAYEQSIFISDDLQLFGELLEGAGWKSHASVPQILLPKQMAESFGAVIGDSISFYAGGFEHEAKLVGILQNNGDQSHVIVNKITHNGIKLDTALIFQSQTQFSDDFFVKINSKITGSNLISLENNNVSRTQDHRVFEPIMSFIIIGYLFLLALIPAPQISSLSQIIFTGFCVALLSLVILWIGLSIGLGQFASIKLSIFKMASCLWVIFVLLQFFPNVFANKIISFYT